MPKRIPDIGIYASIAAKYTSVLSNPLDDEKLSNYFQCCFQDAIVIRHLLPAWSCLNCMTVEFGSRPRVCPKCNHRNVFEVATFQARGVAAGEMFEAACYYILTAYYPSLGVIPSEHTLYRDHCDFYLPGVAGIEVKGSPTSINLDDGTVVHFVRPGMLRTDTEKKASANASTFKRDFFARENSRAKYYVLTSALPRAGWQEDHETIDGVYNVTLASGWAYFIKDLQYAIDVAARGSLGRR
jgi:hypothetical protein